MSHQYYYFGIHDNFAVAISISNEILDDRPGDGPSWIARSAAKYGAQNAACVIHREEKLSDLVPVLAITLNPITPKVGPSEPPSDFIANVDIIYFEEKLEVSVQCVTDIINTIKTVSTDQVKHQIFSVEGIPSKFRELVLLAVKTAVSNMKKVNIRSITRITRESH